jgi:hypothetical protein
MTGFEEARDRAEFCLTYDRCDPREFMEDTLAGPMIPNAFGEGLSPGDWSSGDWPAEDADVETWLAHFAQMAVNEALHEALEWFKVDGKPWLDPHGEMERDIYRATERLCKSLPAMRARSLVEGRDGTEKVA